MQKEKSLWYFATWFKAYTNSNMWVNLPGKNEINNVRRGWHSEPYCTKTKPYVFPPLVTFRLMERLGPLCWIEISADSVFNGIDSAKMHICGDPRPMSVQHSNSLLLCCPAERLIKSPNKLFLEFEDDWTLNYTLVGCFEEPNYRNRPSSHA